MLVWDNQQATSWFVGILEGEGSFHVREGGSKRIQLHNNDKDIIERCEEYLCNNAILFNTYKVKAGTKYGYKLCVSKQDCINLCSRVLPKVECRKDEIQRMLGASETECDLSVDLHWLVGIWEAEGSFMLSKNHRESLTPKLELDNTNEMIVNKIVLNLQELGCSWYRKDYVPDYKKPYTKITIQGVKRCQRFLSQTIDLWRSKRNVKRSTLLLDYASSRLAMPLKARYTDQQLQMYHQMRQLNG